MIFQTLHRLIIIDEYIMRLYNFLISSSEVHCFIVVVPFYYIYNIYNLI